MTKRICLVASGDLRLSANQMCWPAQAALEQAVTAAFARLGATVVRGHGVNPATGHGFLDSQAAGIEAFRRIDPDVPIIVAEAVWQYTSHVLPGLTRHRGPILTLANWSGQWPGLVGMLNLNGSLTKAGVPLFAYGNFITVAINFIILAFIIFMMVKQINRLKKDAPPAPPAATPEDVVLLREIRDALKK